MATVHITGSDGKLISRSLDGQESLAIGRSSKNDLILPDLSLSRNHALLLRQDGDWCVRDAGSRNGTFLNGRLVEGTEVLRPGDRVSIGGCVIVFEPGEEPTGRVFFSDEPLAAEGTVFLPLNDIVTMPEKDVLASPSGSGRKADDVRARLRIIEKANLELLAHEPVETLLPKVLDLVNQAIHPDRAALFLKSPEGDLLCRAFRADSSDRTMSCSRTIARTVMEQHVSVLTSDAQSDARFREGASILAQGIHSVMAVPLWNNKEVIGLIYADSRMASGLFRDDDLRLLTVLANIAAIQIENSRLFESQLERQRLQDQAKAAARIQTRLQPRAAPEILGYRVEGSNVPCYEVGGDYFDYVPLKEGRHAILIADVAGKGMEAAMLMVALRATCHARLEVDSEAETFIPHLNAVMARTAPSNRFVTLVFLDLDPGTHRLRFVNAGHAPEPLVIRASGDIERLPVGGAPLGISTKATYGLSELTLGPRDFVFMCSDGVTDTLDPAGEPFGEERLADLLKSLAGQPPEQVRHAVEERLDAHAAGTRYPDDLTMVVVQRQE